MRAMLLTELGGRLTPGEVPTPKPGPNEALVRVRAAGGADLGLRAYTYIRQFRS